MATIVSLGLAPIARAGPNGFDVSESIVPVHEILAGGPPRDGIPALDDPIMVSASGATWSDDTRVIGVAYGGETRAYPINLLVWHELINDSIAGLPILVSYCPLCGSALVFDRRISGDASTPPERFGVSGLLYHSDMLMFDRRTGSLWLQILAKAVSGEHVGARLRIVPSTIERWGDWRRRYPDSRIASRKTGHRRNYGRSPYGGYAKSRKLRFPAPIDPRHPPKMRTIGLRTADGRHARAYPLETLERAEDGVVKEEFAGQMVSVGYSADRDAFETEVPPGIDVIETYWFAWMAFHPRSSVYANPSVP